MKAHKDKRGIIKDLIVGKKGAATYITFKKGAIRGNHYHKKTTQYDFILSGELICIWGTKEHQFQTVVHGGDLITHKPNTPHTYEALKDSEMISLVYGPRKGEDYASDTFKYPLLEA